MNDIAFLGLDMPTQSEAPPEKARPASSDGRFLETFAEALQSERNRIAESENKPEDESDGPVEFTGALASWSPVGAIVVEAPSVEIVPVMSDGDNSETNGQTESGPLPSPPEPDAQLGSEAQRAPDGRVPWPTGSSTTTDNAVSQPPARTAEAIRRPDGSQGRQPTKESMVASSTERSPIVREPASSARVSPRTPMRSDASRVRRPPAALPAASWLQRVSAVIGEEAPDAVRVPLRIAADSDVDVEVDVDVDVDMQAKAEVEVGGPRDVAVHARQDPQDGAAAQAHDAHSSEPKAQPTEARPAPIRESENGARPSVAPDAQRESAAAGELSNAKPSDEQASPSARVTAGEASARTSNRLQQEEIPLEKPAAANGAAETTRPMSASDSASQRAVDEPADTQRNNQPAPTLQTAASRRLAAMANESLHQMVRSVKADIQEDVSALRLQLRPGSLGDLELRLSVENGIVSARFVAESQEVKALIESALPDLRQQLADQGVSVEQLAVSVGDHSREREGSSGERPASSQERAIGENASTPNRLRGEWVGAHASMGSEQGIDVWA